MIRRAHLIQEIYSRLKTYPIVSILGARQCGKTTLAQQITHDHHFDLENPRDEMALTQGQLILEKLKGTIIIDEIQRKPELFSLLRYLVDNHPDQRYLILGSASQDLIQHSSESLAGRISHLYLTGFTLDEVGDQRDRLWLRGGFPRSFLADTDKESFEWRENYITTFLERDIPQLGISIPASTLRRFWIMLSHYHGQVLNYSELGKSFGVSDMTVRRYLDILNGTFMTRALQPWVFNTKKRLVKAPKLYLRDSGIFHTLQTIETEKELFSHPKLGASWEGFSLEMLCSLLKLSSERFFFCKAHSGFEVDLFWQNHGRNWGTEIKYNNTPQITKSMITALEELKLEKLFIVYPGDRTYEIEEKIKVVSLKDLQREFS